MSNKSQVFPIWSVEERKQILKIKDNKKTKEVTQRIKTTIKGLRQSETKRLKSPDLQFKGLDNSLWYLLIEPRTKQTKQNDSDQNYYFSVCLHLKLKQFEKYCGQISKFKVSIIDTKRGKVWSKSSRLLFFNDGQGWGWKYFVRRDEIFENCKRSLDLSLILSITSIQLQDSNRDQNREELSCGDISQKLDEFAFTHDLMNDKEYCDVHFIIGDMDIAAHSKLLASKSSVFKKLFEKQKEIRITEIDCFVFYEMILFLYKGYSPNIEKYCQKLLIASNYYQISRLKSICDNICFRELHPEEAIDALIFANKYRTFSSRIRTLCYIAIHLNQIKKSFEENWDQFVIKNQLISNEVLEIAEMKCECIQH